MLWHLFPGKVSEMKRGIQSILVVSLFLAVLPGVSADPFVDAVVSFTQGAGGGFGSENFPDVIFGPPRGAGEFAQSLDVFSLGDGGSIVLEFTDNTVLNGPGPDLIVFENPFYVSQNPLNTFCEVAFVEVSQDGSTFYRFPNDYDPTGDPMHNPANWTGFAGVMPVLSHPENEIDPTDPLVSGGDTFDLDDLGLDWIRYVRIVDTGEAPDAAHDDDGDEIYDQGMPGGVSAGFDLDAVAAVHGEDLFTPTPTQTPTDTPTPENTPVPTETPTATATPGEFVCDLVLSGTHFRPGDRFILDSRVWNPGFFKAKALNLIITLEISGEYYFWPTWGRNVDGEWRLFTPGFTEIGILDFIWPDFTGHDGELTFWSILLDSYGEITGNIEMESFTF